MRVYGRPLANRNVALKPKSCRIVPAIVPLRHPCGKFNARLPAIVWVRLSAEGSSAWGGGARSPVTELICREIVFRYSFGSEPVVRADWNVYTIVPWKIWPMRRSSLTSTPRTFPKSALV